MGQEIHFATLHVFKPQTFDLSPFISMLPEEQIQPAEFKWTGTIRISVVKKKTINVVRRLLAVNQIIQSSISN